MNGIQTRFDGNCMVFASFNRHSRLADNTYIGHLKAASTLFKMDSMTSALDNGVASPSVLIFKPKIAINAANGEIEKNHRKLDIKQRLLMSRQNMRRFIAMNAQQRLSA